MVQVSTDEVYGDLEAGGSSLEGDPLRPSSPYSATKAGGDLLVPSYVRTYGVNASTTRGANTYGPNQYPEKLIPLFATNAFDGIPLPVYGDGKQVREWLHVDDHCAAIDLVLREGVAGEAYNVGGEARENIHVTAGILELTGADPCLVRHVEDRAGHDRRYCVDDTRLPSLGWAPAHRFDEDGLASTVAWYRDTEPGGSRSSPASTAATTRSSTPAVSTADVHPPSASRPRSAAEKREECGTASPRRRPLLTAVAALRRSTGSSLRAPPRRRRHRCSCSTGGGWGHGVGMAQWGAYGQAKEGRTFDQILTTYYTGVELDPMPRRRRRRCACSSATRRSRWRSARRSRSASVTRARRPDADRA